MKILWNFATKPIAQSGNWSIKSIFPAFARITRYWDVQFVQVSRGQHFQILLTNERGNSMWQRGNRIFAQSDYCWINKDQMVLALVHEFGHWLVKGGGHMSQPGHVMSEVLGDPFINFTQQDMRWFGRLRWKSSLRPWDEPNFWRHTRS
jgi:hypothetical protein